ncbi:MAG: hypothetical protein AAF919_09750 [Pseudomonadota bacterium]
MELPAPPMPRSVPPLTGVGAGPNALLTFAVFVLSVLALFGMRIGSGGFPTTEVLMASLGNDSAMRLISVRDLLAGQGWFDPVQTRLGPEGTPMHWSRLIDGPMAAILLALEPWIGMERAEYVLLVAWPTVIAGAILAVTFSIGRALAGASGGLLVFVVTFLSLPIGWRSAFGDIDHHTVQLLLLFVALHGFLYRHQGARHPVLAGVAIAASLCIGVETLPLLGVMCLAFAALWAFEGEDERSAAIRFATGLGVGFLVLFGLTAPPMAWRGGFCDAASVDLGVPFAGGALTLALVASFLTHAPRGQRALSLLGGLVVIGALTIALFPACLTNPYDALDPYLTERWLVHVSEAQGLWDMIADGGMPRSLAAAGFAVAMMLFALAVDRRRLALPVLLLALAWVIAAYQVRGALHMMGLAALVAGANLALLQHKARASGAGETLRMSLAAMLTVIPFAFSLGIASGIWPALANGGIANTVGNTQVANATADDPETCRKPSDWAALGALPAGRVAATVDLGTGILRETAHSVFSAPYHRNQTGMIAMLRLASAPTDAEALTLLTEFDVDYVVICPYDANLNLLREKGEVGFMHRLWDGETAPNFLAEYPSEGPVRIWRVTPPQS